MMKQYVLVVEPISTGMNYLTDIVRLGYTPLALFPYLEVTAETAAFVDEARKAYAGSFPAETLVLYAPASYDELLAQLKQYDIVCAVVGHETGAEVGDRLAADLGLPGNPPASSRRHRDKDAMQQALKDHGLRHIRGKIIHSAAEAEAFIDEEGLGKTVVKHIDGMSSTGLHICDTRAQALAAVQLELGKTNGFGKETGAVLLQEFIAGTEYVVNTVSCNGKHCITDVWRYRKVAVGSDGNPYDHAMLLTRLEPEHVEMCRYALQAVDALASTCLPKRARCSLRQAAGPWGQTVPSVSWIRCWDTTSRIYRCIPISHQKNLPLFRQKNTARWQRGCSR